jgi:O-antigen ligase
MTPPLSTVPGASPAGRRAPGCTPAILWGRLFAALVIIGWAIAPAVGFLASLRLLTVVAFGGAFVGFRRPAIGLPAITLACTLDPLTRHFLITPDGLLRWNTFNYWLLLIMGLSIGFLTRVSDPHSRMLKLFIGLLAVDLVFSPALEMGLQHILGAVTMFGLLVYCAQARDDSDVWYMVGVVNGLAGALGGLAFFLLQDTLPHINANAWAMFPETAIFCVCLGYRQAQARAHGQLILGLLGTVNYLWVFLSGSRGGLLIASVAVLFVVAAMRRTAERLVYAAAAALIAAAVSSMFTSQQERTLSRLATLLDDGRSVAARTSGRSDLARAGFHMVREHPFGVGTGGFAPTWAHLGFVPGVSGFMRGREFQAHAGWIKVLAENGWPGLVLLAAYVASFAIWGLSSGRPGAAGLGLLVTATLAVTFLSTEFQGKGFWLLAAAATAQLHPAEMARCLAVEARHFGTRPRRVLRAAHA